MVAEALQAAAKARGQVAGALQMVMALQKVVVTWVKGLEGSEAFSYAPG